MRKIPAINATIMAANEKTRQAEAALGNADEDAREAKNKAEEAGRIASNVQKVNRPPTFSRHLETVAATLLVSCPKLITTIAICAQGSAKTKEDAEKAFQDTNKMDNEVNDMMDQLNAAERELARKKAEADQDMMMAGMVQPGSGAALCFNKGILGICRVGFCAGLTLFTFPQASNNAKEAEDNARKAKSAVKTVLSTITTLLDQLGKNRAASCRSETPVQVWTSCPVQNDAAGRVCMSWITDNPILCPAKGSSWRDFSSVIARNSTSSKHNCKIV